MTDRTHDCARGGDGTAGAGVSRPSSRRAGIEYATGAARVQSTAPRRRRAPAYARTVRPGTRDIRAYLGDWEAARADADQGRAVVLLSDDTDPDAVDWRCCAGADVLLRWRCTEADSERVHRMAVAMVRTGAAMVLCVETTGAPEHRMALYRRRTEARRRAA
jgi:hypothetical protein